MAFFVVVHHKRDQDQPWKNHWLDDDRLQVIETTEDIAARCAEAQRRGERVFVHRCGWLGGPPMVCCSVAIKNARHGSNLGWVEFHDPVILDIPPTVQPGRGQNCYDAPPPVSATV